VAGPIVIGTARGSREINDLLGISTLAACAVRTINTENLIAIEFDAEEVTGGITFGNLQPEAQHAVSALYRQRLLQRGILPRCGSAAESCPPVTGALAATLPAAWTARAAELGPHEIYLLPVSGCDAAFKPTRCHPVDLGGWNGERTFIVGFNQAGGGTAVTTGAIAIVTGLTGFKNRVATDLSVRHGYQWP